MARSSKLSLEARTVIATLTDVEMPEPSSQGGLFTHTMWEVNLPDGTDVPAWSDITHKFKNYKRWKSFLANPKIGTQYRMVIHDNLDLHTQQAYLLDADYEPRIAKYV